MKKILNIAVASATTLMIIGCSDTYDSDEKTYTPQTAKSMGSLQREVDYLTDAANEMSLYIFDKDTLFPTTTNCDADCQKIWPIFTGSNTESTDIIVFDTNTSHLAYRQHPMYFFKNDTTTGDVNGDNIKGVWHLIYAPTGTNDTQAKFSSAENSMTQTYLTGKDGMALYTFDKDNVDESVCYGTPDTKPLGSCEARWPVFYSADLSGLPAGTTASDFATIDRNLTKALKDDNGDVLATKQTTYKGQPLYYWFKDAKAGDTTGDWVGGVWHLIELSAQKTSTITPSPYTQEAAAAGKAIFTDPAKCSSCHGADGQTKPLGVDNIIAKYGDAALIEQKLRDMRDNGNPNNRNSAMVNVASGLSDTAITNLSAFVATLKK